MKGKLPPPWLKPWDVIIMLLALCLTGFSAFGVYPGRERQSRVHIRGGGGEWLFPLDAEETVRVAGPRGETVIRIAGGEAWVESSPCENQTCVAGGRIAQNGLWTACLPNGVFLMIEGSNERENAPDAGAW